MSLIYNQLSTLMMKKLFVIAAASLIASSCGSKTANHQPSANKQNTEMSDSNAIANNEKTTNDDAERNAFTFSTSLRNDANGQCDALTLTCKSGDTTQRFTFEFNWPKDKEVLEMEEVGQIAEDDINFDGIPDVVVRLGNFGISPDAPMMFYGACTWNKDKKIFEMVEDYSEIPNPKVGSLNSQKAIISQYKGIDGTAQTEHYQWKDGKLVKADNND